MIEETEVKRYVLDTNILLYHIEVLEEIDEYNEYYLPFVVLEELDKLKTSPEIGFEARRAIRAIKESNVKIDMEFSSEKRDKNDDIIISCAKHHGAILYTKDIALSIKASVDNVLAIDYANVLDENNKYNGSDTLEVEDFIIDKIYKTGELDLSEYPGFYPNQYLTLTSNMNEKHSALVRVDINKNRLVLLKNDMSLMDIIPRNKEQKFAFDALTNSDIKLVTLVGLAGSGKSLNALAAALYQVLETKIYKKVLVYRPIVPMGNELGFIPGSLSEKLSPWMQPISDNIDFIINGTYKKPEEISHHKKPRAVKVNGESKPKKKFYDDDEKDVGKLSATKELESFDLLEMGALMYIRGRSLPDQIIIIDEAQNTTAHEIRTIITRAGEGTKIILTGDPSQIDAPYLNHNNNGLSYVANKFKSESIAAHIVFKKSERSELAEIAARILI